MALASALAAHVIGYYWLEAGGGTHLTDGNQRRLPCTTKRTVSVQYCLREKPGKEGPLFPHQYPPVLSLLSG